jgi:ubiquinone/menaquinone biosynthesis C-methylase UbiE
VICDYLTVIGLLTKNNGHYGLTSDSAVFLDRKSPAYLGSVVDFLGKLQDDDPAFRDITGAVRKGGTVATDDGTVRPDNPIWVSFARSMAPMMTMPADLIARVVTAEGGAKNVLDIAAGHGLFGIAVAKQNPGARITAVDWPRVLDVASENAAAAGITDRYQTRPGSAFDVEFGSGYDLVLLTNFLHHFDPKTCETLLRRLKDSMAPGGRVITLEFIPNPDRVSPPFHATFSLIMLATTGAGDAYTFAEFEQMFSNAGFARSELRELVPTPHRIVISHL